MYEIDYAIPILDWHADAGSYRDVPIDTADPRNREPLVDIS